jgi:hypothetical protein
MNGNLLLVTGLLILASASLATPAGAFDVDWYTIDGGGESWTTGGDFALAGTVGQPDAGAVMQGGPFALTGGFWVAAGSPQWCLGDADCSGGGPDFLDIESFVAALGGEASWTAYYQNQHGGALPACPYRVNDLNGGGVEFTDIQAFVDHLGQPCDPL